MNVKRGEVQIIGSDRGREGGSRDRNENPPEEWRAARPAQFSVAEGGSGPGGAGCAPRVTLDLYQRNCTF